MDDTLTPSGRRAAATWVTATGVMLLLAAATLFVAVRWDHISDGAKLGALGLVTVGALLAGHAMRPGLPATGDVVFHLGALLVPVDLAAAAVRLGADWRAFLLTEGITSAAAFTVFAVLRRSVVLRWAARLSVPVAAAGLAASSGVPAGLVLAVTAVVAVTLPRRSLRDAGVVWASLAVTAPVLGAAAALVAGVEGVRIGMGTLHDLGLLGTPLAVAALPTGVVGAFALATEAHRRRDLRLASAALVAVLVGVGTMLTGSHVGPGLGTVAIAGTFATFELAALAVRRDPFWTRPFAKACRFAEVLVALPSALCAYLLLLAPFAADGPFAAFAPGVGDRAGAAALALLALGWLTADLRRVEPGAGPLTRLIARGSGRRDLTPLAVLTLSGATLVGTRSSGATAIALFVSLAATVAARRAGAREMAVWLVPWAVVCSAGQPGLAVALAGLGGFGLAVTISAAEGTRAARLVGAGAAVTVLLGGGAAAASWPLAWVTVATVATCWALAALLDARRRGTGDVARVAGVVPLLAAAAGLPPASMLATMTVATALLTLDAVRLRRPNLLFSPALLVQFVVVDAALAIGLTPAAAGVAVCTSAFTWAGLAATVDDDWRAPLIAAAGAGVALGLLLASAEPAMLASAVMITGALVVFGGVLVRKSSVIHLGAALATAGLFLHLAIAGVDTVEWYLTPVGVQLLVAGWQLHRSSEASSWSAYSPTILLLGLSAFVERVAGGSGPHALYAGAVGAGAVVLGGWRRLAGPLVVGTGLLVLVIGHESMSSLAGVSTWMWFALGGAALVAAGITLERGDHTPVEAGRRLVEIFAERFQ